MDGSVSPNRLALRLRRQRRNGGSEPGLEPHAAKHVHEHEERADTDKTALLRDQLVRTQAEFDNFRKRTRRDQAQQSELASKMLIEDLLPAIDNFDRALTSPGDSVASLLSGIQMIRKQLGDVLERAGLEKIDALGQPFDPNRHEAVTTGQAGEVPDNHVMEVMQPGYLLKGKILRPAMVRVARG